ncbi:MAG: hypothetical protein B7X00_00225, partial [Legionella sp. 21-45-4]
LPVLEHLESQAPDQIQAMIAVNRFSAYRYAAENGHLPVLEHLESQAPDQIQTMIAANTFAAYRFAAENGHLLVLKHLESQAPDQIQVMIAAYDFYAYRYAAENSHLEVCNHLLSQSSACFAYAERHQWEYGAIIRPFIQERLSTLHQESLTVPAQTVFDIADSEQAKRCFYILRHLIRCNERQFDDELRFLLSIPAVKDLAHQAVTPNQPNELLRLALTTNNQAAAEILLTIPAVRTLAEQNDYYRAEARGHLDLARLAQDRESSMTALTQGEQARLDTAIRHYQPLLQAAGVSQVMANLREELEKRFAQNPACFEDATGRVIQLPLTFADFNGLNLNAEDYQNALTAYYQHKDHTAWRYLAKPNPWMNPEASYVYTNEDHSERWSTFEDYQPLISLLWLAAIDSERMPTEDHTLEGRINHFIDELAQIGRAHNWDGTRTNAKGKEEEYDDLSGDRPSCYSGVKRRLFQAVMGHPLISILTQDIILEEIKSVAKAHFETQLLKVDSAQLQDAYLDYSYNPRDEVREESKAQLALLNISDEALRQFDAYLTNKYGAQFTEDASFIRLVRVKLQLQPNSNEPSFHYHAILLDGLTGFYNLLFKKNLVSDAGDSDSYEEGELEVLTQTITEEDNEALSTSTPSPSPIQAHSVNNRGQFFSAIPPREREAREQGSERSPFI